MAPRGYPRNAALRMSRRDPSQSGRVATFNAPRASMMRVCEGSDGDDGFANCYLPFKGSGTDANTDFANRKGPARSSTGAGVDERPGPWKPRVFLGANQDTRGPRYGAARQLLCRYVDYARRNGATYHGDQDDPEDDHRRPSSDLPRSKRLRMASHASMASGVGSIPMPSADAT